MTFTQRATADFAKFTKAKFEHAYAVFVLTDGSILDRVHQTAYPSFADWAAVMESTSAELLI